MMSENRPDDGRRRFLRGAAAGIIAAPVAWLPGARTASAEQPRLDPSNPQAKALNYVHDAADASGAPGFKEGANCANCLQWTGGDAEWGGCNIFPGKLVARDGWCTAWVKTS